MTAVSRDSTKILLDEDEMPTRWYNIVPDLPSAPPPPLHPEVRNRIPGSSGHVKSATLHVCKDR